MPVNEPSLAGGAAPAAGAAGASEYLLRNTNELLGREEIDGVKTVRQCFEASGVTGIDPVTACRVWTSCSAERCSCTFPTTTFSPRSRT